MSLPRAAHYAWCCTKADAKVEGEKKKKKIKSVCFFSTRGPHCALVVEQKFCQGSTLNGPGCNEWMCSWAYIKGRPRFVVAQTQQFLSAESLWLLISLVNGFSFFCLFRSTCTNLAKFGYYLIGGLLCTFLNRLEHFSKRISFEFCLMNFELGEGGPGDWRLRGWFLTDFNFLKTIR